MNLAWNPAKYGGIKSLIVPAENLWIPEIHLFNSATEDDRIYPANVELWSNGTVITAPLNTLYGHCDYNFKRFPYDSQRCDFIVSDPKLLIILLRPPRKLCNIGMNKIV